ncbi:hypothetical protein CALVIDRAFT_68193 [Calocera viscosa TUFC12733]|uniref:Uncharacterized protein n=1 Tax=Calocera viscosa (strain TUFC12733) TaxID=1330018 RepID=A0A167N8U0_CALVF|nr:hypothetical protein CALVIDRAFT_68193 [Calocera viscosa TUFC12733]
MQDEALVAKLGCAARDAAMETGNVRSECTGNGRQHHDVASTKARLPTCMRTVPSTPHRLLQSIDHEAPARLCLPLARHRRARYRPPCCARARKCRYRRTAWGLQAGGTPVEPSHHRRLLVHAAYPDRAGNVEASQLRFVDSFSSDLTRRRKKEGGKAQEVYVQCARTAQGASAPRRCYTRRSLPHQRRKQRPGRADPPDRYCQGSGEGGRGRGDGRRGNECGWSDVGAGARARECWQARRWMREPPFPGFRKHAPWAK